jgi:hypothetical protein
VKTGVFRVRGVVVAIPVLGLALSVGGCLHSPLYPDELDYARLAEAWGDPWVSPNKTLTPRYLHEGFATPGGVEAVRWGWGSSAEVVLAEVTGARTARWEPVYAHCPFRAAHDSGTLDAPTSSEPPGDSDPGSVVVQLVRPLSDGVVAEALLTVDAGEHAQRHRVAVEVTVPSRVHPVSSRRSPVDLSGLWCLQGDGGWRDGVTGQVSQVGQYVSVADQGRSGG